jgi:hypothetical protein
VPKNDGQIDGHAVAVVIAQVYFSSAQSGPGLAADLKFPPPQR